MPKFPEPPAVTTPPRAVVWAGLALVLAIVAAYANSLGGPFVYDDTPAIVENPTFDSLRAALTPAAGATTSGRPVLNLSFALNRALGGLDVRGYHAANILIHALAALTLFGLVRRTLLLPALRDRFGASATWLAFTVAALWALHPLQTESITYLVQRAESLMGLFFLLTLYGFVRSVASPAPRRWQAFSVAACLLGMATKENMVAAPLLVLLLDRALLAGTCAAAWRLRTRYYVALAATWVLLAALVLSTGGNRGGSAGFDVGIPWWAYAFTQFPALVTYLRLSFWPHPLIFDYGTFWVRHVATIAMDALIVLPLLASALWALWRKPALGVLGALFFAVLAPTSLVPGTTQMIVEHRMYLPLAAVIALVAFATHGLAGRRGVVGLLVLAVGLAFLTSRRNADYRTEISIWQDAATKRPTSTMAHYGFGFALAAAGRNAEAIAEYEAAVRLRPNYFEAHNNLYPLLADAGRTAEAMRHLEAALAINPDYPEAVLNLGVSRGKAGYPDEAFLHYERALRLKPRFAEAHNALGDALLRRGQVPAALEHIREALKLKPAFADAHYNLANALLQAGHMSEAEAEFATALTLRPNDAPARIAWSNTLLTTGHLAEALASYEAALQLSPNDANGRYNHGNALATAQRFPEAIREYEHALRLDPAQAEAHNNLGNALMALDRDAEAIPHYDAALRLKPANPSAHNNLGLALARTGRIAEAAGHFEEAVRQAPDYREARDNLARARADLSTTAPTR